MVKTPRNHERAADKAQISVALTRSLLDDVEKVAQHEDRNRNKMINILLQEACNARIAKIVSESESALDANQELRDLLEARTKLPKNDPLYLSKEQVKKLLPA